jgi:hypothetical protein
MENTDELVQDIMREGRFCTGEIRYLLERGLRARISDLHANGRDVRPDNLIPETYQRRVLEKAMPENMDTSKFTLTQLREVAAGFELDVFCTGETLNAILNML